MVHELIITEKPSAARRIAHALSNNRIETVKQNGVSYYNIKKDKKSISIVSAVGHLFTIAEKKKSFKYPVFDIHWQPVYKDNKNSLYAKKYSDTIKKVAKRSSSFIVACDYDIEGEVIGLNVLRFLCNQKDAKRMKFSTLTKPDLIEAYENKSKTLDWGQAKAGEARHYLDWMYGINLSRALTLAIRKQKAYRTMSSGRVQGPALRILTEREKEIQRFKPKKYWQLKLLGKKGTTNVEAWHYKDKIWNEKEAAKILTKTKGHNGIIADITKTEKKQPPPYPFDLTTLQTESYQLFGFSPKRTLDIAQDLYSKSYISYPRTSSQELSFKIGFKKILKNLMKQSLYKELCQLVLATKLMPNNGKKTDPAHPAIYPTGIPPKTLEQSNKKLYDLIVKRFFATFGEAALRQTITAKIDVNTEIFVARGTRTVEKGWHKLYYPYVKLKEETLPKLDLKDNIQVKKISKIEKQTEPPKRFTQATIIKELEKRNLGTKATRAQIIENLYNREYVVGKSIEVTKLGMKTVETLAKYCPEIIDEKLTQSFNADMKEIRLKKAGLKKILEKAEHELTHLLNAFKKHEVDIGKELAKSYIETERERTYMGICPVCKKGELHILQNKKTKSRFIACDRYPKCKTTFNVPQTGDVKKTDKVCGQCGYPIIEIRKGKIPKRICINKQCKSKKPEDKMVKKEESEMKHHIVEEECPKCKEGVLIVKKSVYGHFLACNRFPKCRYTQNIKGEPLKEDFKN